MRIALSLIAILLLPHIALAQPGPGQIGIYLDEAGDQATAQLNRGMIFDVFVLAGAVEGGIKVYVFNLNLLPSENGIFTFGSEVVWPNGISCPEFHQYACFSETECTLLQPTRLVRRTFYLSPELEPGTHQVCLGPSPLFGPDYVAYTPCGASGLDQFAPFTLANACVTVEVLPSVETVPSSFGAVKALYRRL